MMIFTKPLLPPMVILTYLVCTLSAQTNRSNYGTVEVALAVFRKQYLNQAFVVIGQGSQLRQVRGMMTQFQTSVVTPATLWRLENTYFRTGVLIDKHGMDIFREGAVQPYLNSSYRWLIMSDFSLETTFRQITFRVDTSVTIGILRNNGYDLFDVYGAVKVQQVGRFDETLHHWVDAENSLFRSRLNRFVDTGVQVLNISDWKPTDTIERFNLLRGHPRTPATFFGMTEFQVFAAVAELYNMTIRVHIYPYSGYINEYGVFSGLIGGVQSGEVQVAALKVIMYDYRLAAGDFLNMCDLFRLGVTYYVSESLDSPVALLEVFSWTLWGAIWGTFLIITLILHYFSRWEEDRINKSEALLIITGTLTSQGHPAKIQRFSSRTVLLVALLTGFLLASAYSAVIVRALLSAPAPNIRSREDYMRSPLKMAVENYFHFIKGVFNSQMDDETRELYEKKVTAPGGGGFCGVAEAFKGVLDQRWAFYALVNTIKQAMATATPQQICRLSWIRSLQHDNKICAVSNKKSELTNLLNRGYPLIYERGIENREKQRFQASPVTCRPEHKRQWAPVKIKIAMSAVGVVMGGVLASLLVFALERINESIVRYFVLFNCLSPVLLVSVIGFVST